MSYYSLNVIDQSDQNEYPLIANLSPSIWGSSTWKFLHSIALTYPDRPSAKHKAAMRSLIRSLQYILPCEACRLNVSQELYKNPLDPHLCNRQRLNVWLTELHNSVNERLGQPKLTSVDVIKSILGNSKSDSCSCKTNVSNDNVNDIIIKTKPTKHNIAIVILSLIIIVLICVLCVLRAK